MNIIVVEDDHKISDFVSNGLRQEGHQVDTAFDGIAGLELLRRKEYDLIILDLMLPQLDGLSVLKVLKSENITPPVLILSAKQSVDDKVKGLNMGADDYLVKPFSFAELMARINAVSRRSSEPTRETQYLQMADLVLDRLTRKVTVAGKSVELQTKEFSLLELFLKNTERVLSKNMILDRVWNIDFDPQTNVVDVLVCRLRNKLERASGKRYITTVRGMGYVLNKEDPN
ncbi:MAG: response regulator transcription factor [Bdellovibrionales bacterium]|nr:response regulator transcription factor [Bdellovibrionales bacterium]